MANFCQKVELNHDFIEELYNTSAVQGIVSSKAKSVFMRVSGGKGKYRIGSAPGRKGGRFYWYVAADNYEAMKDNAQNNTLIKALGAG